MDSNRRLTGLRLCTARMHYGGPEAVPWSLIASSGVASYVRYQSAVPNRHGRYPGVFAMANGLAQEGRLSATDRRTWRSLNDRANAMYPDPERHTPGTMTPGARSWFRTTCRPVLLEMTAHYLELLDRHAIPWVELRTNHPGQIVYRDDDQVVAVPFTRDAWPF